MAPTSRRAIAILVFLGAVVGFFCFYGSSNDHFDRLARARQIAMYGDVPFRDFFDPGYFLTLYSSALMIRVFGDNMLSGQSTLLEVFKYQTIFFRKNIFQVIPRTNAYSRLRKNMIGENVVRDNDVKVFIE